VEKYLYCKGRLGVEDIGRRREDKREKERLRRRGNIIYLNSLITLSTKSLLVYKLLY